MSNPLCLECAALRAQLSDLQKRHDALVADVSYMGWKHLPSIMTRWEVRDEPTTGATGATGATGVKVPVLSGSDYPDYAVLHYILTEMNIKGVNRVGVDYYAARIDVTSKSFGVDGYYAGHVVGNAAASMPGYELFIESLAADLAAKTMREVAGKLAERG